MQIYETFYFFFFFPGPFFAFILHLKNEKEQGFSFLFNTAFLNKFYSAF